MRAAVAPEASATPALVEPDTAPDPESSRIAFSNLPLHQLFEQQATAMLERTDLDEEQKQAILIGMSCPCCGSGGLSFTVKLCAGSRDEERVSGFSAGPDDVSARRHWQDRTPLRRRLRVQKP
jgi:hypothetical protein